ncbi:MAG: polymer-forming cytoskeletal protein [gamma proteobacterium symbiont of Bathyaustriella thionipta]|nr:polymer-forming cytoskeletal protein [gamma proteobacterium symbiont of Bathyaustriella thionipta]
MARNKKFRPPKISTVIGLRSEVQGNVTFAGGLHIDGAVKGNVIAEPDGISTLTLSEKGMVEGEIRVPNVILNGEVIGDVYASERVELAPQAKVTGNVYYKMLQMTMGAEVNGQLIHDEQDQKMLGHESDARPAADVKPDSSKHEPKTADKATTEKTAAKQTPADATASGMGRERRGR